MLAGSSKSNNRVILALETSTRVCSVALLDREGKVHEKRIAGRGVHSEKLFVFIEELMKEHGFDIAGLERLLVSGGPGSYTGLRISASAVKGLLFGLEVPLYAANTLAGFAAGVAPQTKDARIHAVIDARRVHLYHQVFEWKDGNLQATGTVKVRPIEEVQQDCRDRDVIVGSGIQRMDEELLRRLEVFGPDHVSGRGLLRLDEFHAQSKLGSGEEALIERMDPEHFDPRYYGPGQVRR